MRFTPLSFVIFCTLTACSTPQTNPGLSASAPPQAASAFPSATTSAATPQVASAIPSATAALGSAAAAPSAAPPTASASAAAPTGPAPKGKVSNIGMHIGGGPNDDPTKEPIRRSVEPYFDDFRRCYAALSDATSGDFGIDLRIPKDGGLAQVTHPRCAIKDKAFHDCVVSVFERVQFRKPKGGVTVVSYSLRFSP